MSTAEQARIDALQDEWIAKRRATPDTATVPGVAASDPRPWARYARKSRIGKGAHVSIENQQAETGDYLEAVAGPVAIVDFADNASGWDENKRRPAWEKLLQGLAHGDYAGVVGWHSDRFTRQPAQLEQLIAACRKGGTQLHTRLGGHHADPTMIRIEMALAAKESDVKSERQKMKHAQLARDGKSHGGRRAFGWDITRTALVPDEAKAVRLAARSLLAGKSLRSIAREMPPTVTGKPWTGSNLATYLRRPMLAGYRIHHGEIVGQGDWPAILDVGTWQAVQALLTDPSRRVSKAAPRVYLLSGLARCGGCGGPMRGRSNASAGLASAYHCHNSQAGCAYRRADLVDAQVRAWVVARLAQVDVTGALSLPDDPSERVRLEDRLSELAANLGSLAILRVQGRISEAQLLAATAEADRESASLRAQLHDMALEQRRPAEALQGLAGLANAADLFDDLGLERQRQVVDLLCSITIMPGARGQTYDPALVVISPRG